MAQASEKEAGARTLEAVETTLKAAGVNRTNFQRGFIKAKTVACDVPPRCGSVAAALERGLYRKEGKEYEVKDGNVMAFRFDA